MANRNIQVDLTMRANVEQAKQQIASLQQSLSEIGKLSTTSNIGAATTQQLIEAQNAAAQLKIQLQDAFNVNTGKLDLSKFNQLLKLSGMTLSDYKTKLTTIGPMGQQAFAQLTQSIVTAEIPIVRISSKLSALGQTLANTAKWQISSGILHGFMRSVSTAYNYAKDLNESLNNIRIVTGQNTEQMAKFADKANKAAQALSTSTTSYTDASLIYYQQGKTKIFVV